jgi:hypothetical protein
MHLDDLGLIAVHLRIAPGGKTTNARADYQN